MMFSNYLTSYVLHVCYMRVHTMGFDLALVAGDALIILTAMIFISKKLPWWGVIPTFLFVAPLAIIAWHFGAVLAMMQLNVFVG